MKKLLPLLAFMALFISACSSAPVLEEGKGMEETSPYTFEYTTEDMVTVNKDGVKLVEVEVPFEFIGADYEAVVFEETAENVYIAINPTGLGGRIFYGGAHTVYQVSLSTGEVLNTLLAYGGFITDISSNEAEYVYFSQSAEGWDMTIQTFDGPEKGIGSVYTVTNSAAYAGDGEFSPDGSKVAYSSIAEDESWAQVYILDLASEEFTLYAEDADGSVQVYDVDWQDNDRPIAE
jgi:hypothetical protein